MLLLSFPGMIHSGVFVERHYCRFAGIVHGQKTHDFLRKLVERGYARPIQVGSLHRGRLFHVSHMVPLLGGQKLDAITSAKVQQLKLHLQDKSPKTVNNVLATLRGASARCGATGVAGGSVED